MTDRIIPHLVSTAWLAAEIGAPDLRVYDCTTHLEPDPPAVYRVVNGAADYARAHIRDAALIDLQGQLSDNASPLRFTLPTPDAFAAAAGALGIGDSTRVVLYAGKHPMWASRVWWMLRVMGFERAAVLDGGWEKWLDEGRPATHAATRYPAAALTPRFRPELVADKDAVLAAVTSGGACVLNALSREQHAGGGVSYGRPGRIAGSSVMPARELIDGAAKTFLPPERLRELAAAAGTDGAGRIVTYCGGGIAATATALALALIGREDVAVYDGSLGEWAADPTLPMETG